MNKDQYKKHLEKKLIRNFITEFNEKMGYTPTVITKKNLIKKITLKSLEEHFQEYMPTIMGTKISSLGSKRRNRPLVELRFIFCFIAKKLNYTLDEIGDFLGKRDHTTVIYAIRTFKNLYETDVKFKLLYNEIITKIKTNIYDTSDMEHIDKMEIESQPDLFFALLQV